jgi:hypothetical protein
MGLISDRRLFLTAGQKLVEEGDPEAAFQLVSPGGMIEDADVQKYGLELKGDKVTQKKAPAGGVVVSGGALLDPRGAVEAAVKDRLKADWEVKVQAETDKEMERIEGEVGGRENAYSFALNRAGVMSREALERRGEAPHKPEVEESAAAVEADLKNQDRAEQKAPKSGKK